MLTFKNAPKTLLGPCEHALWCGHCFASRHHIHMDQGPENWRARVEDALKDPKTQVLVGEVVVHNRALRAAVCDKEAHKAQLAQWTKASQALGDKFKALGL